MDPILNKLQEHANHLPVVIMSMIMTGQWDKIYFMIMVIIFVQAANCLRNAYRTNRVECSIKIATNDDWQMFANIAKFITNNNCYIGNFKCTNLGLIIPSDGTATYTYHDIKPADKKVSSNDNYTNQHIVIKIIFSTIALPANTGLGVERGCVEIICAKQVITNFLSFVSEYIKAIEEKEKKNHLILNLWENRAGMWRQRIIDITKTRKNMFLSTINESIIYSALETFNKQFELYRSFGVPIKKGILLEGPPGSGKSSFAHYIANYFNMEIFKINGEAITNYPEQAFANIRNRSVVVINDFEVVLGTKATHIITLPDTLIQHTKSTDEFKSNLMDLMPYILHTPESIPLHTYCYYITQLCDIRELEKILQKLINMYNIQSLPQADFLRQYIVSTYTNDQTTKHKLYDIFDGVEYLRECILIITTNNLDAIDKTMIRSGRIDLVARFDHADQSIVNRIFQHAFQRDGPIIGKHKIAQSSIISTILAAADYGRAYEQVIELIPKQHN